MKVKITSLFLVLIISGCCQNKPLDCESTLNRVPFFVRNNVASSSDSLAIDLQILRECGQLDSIDSELLSPQLLGTLLMKFGSQSKTITYRTILSDFNELKKVRQYGDIRNAAIAKKSLENKIVNYFELEGERTLLLKLGMTELEFTEFKEFALKQQNKQSTYKELLTLYFTSKKKIESPGKEPIRFGELKSYEEALKAGAESKKRVLIYFTCHTCINARKMEDYILRDEKVKSIMLENYICLSGYVDDKRPTENNESTLGQKYMKIQSDKFKSNFQPQFYIIDSKGTIIANIGYTTNTEGFIVFLKKGLQ